MDMDPENLDKAVKYVISAMTNQEWSRVLRKQTFQDTNMDISFVVKFRS
jgi:hypothetical protein